MAAVVPTTKPPLATIRDDSRDEGTLNSSAQEHSRLHSTFLVRLLDGQDVHHRLVGSCSPIVNGRLEKMPDQQDIL